MPTKGVSGAGKTTLLNVLADRLATGVVSGEVWGGDARMDGASAKGIGYAQQQDVHLPTSTIREALTFSALLRQPQKFSRQQRLDYVDEVIDVLDLGPFAEAVIGEAGEGKLALAHQSLLPFLMLHPGLNVEQRRRFTIGVELVARPQLLLFLDEPTSGLDSDTAWLVCTLLRKLADHGQAILCTIHQPSTILFRMFDRLLLLTEGGKAVYFGDIGPDASTVLQYFEKRGAQPCEIARNPAEWMIALVDGGTEEENFYWVTEWQKSPQRAKIKEEIQTMRQWNCQRLKATATHPEHRAELPPITELYIVTRRAFQHYWRTPSYLYSKALLCVGSVSIPAVPA